MQMGGGWQLLLLFPPALSWPLPWLLLLPRRRLLALLRILRVAAAQQRLQRVGGCWAHRYPPQYQAAFRRQW